MTFKQLKTKNEKCHFDDLSKRSGESEEKSPNLYVSNKTRMKKLLLEISQSSFFFLRNDKKTSAVISMTKEEKSPKLNVILKYFYNKETVGDFSLSFG